MYALSPCHPERMHKIGSTKFEGSLPLAATTQLRWVTFCDSRTLPITMSLVAPSSQRFFAMFP